MSRVSRNRRAPGLCTHTACHRMAEQMLLRRQGIHIQGFTKRCLRWKGQQVPGRKLSTSPRFHECDPDLSVYHLLIDADVLNLSLLRIHQLMPPHPLCVLDGLAMTTEHAADRLLILLLSVVAHDVPSELLLAHQKLPMHLLLLVQRCHKKRQEVRSQCPLLGRLSGEDGAAALPLRTFEDSDMLLVLLKFVCRVPNLLA
mmetsp:Transcript_29829/g.50625  ORF Transcript_29829/g.50625 Transcript_29829/m.50625 type:complete len:200 (-) Transcript_29829:746-1345(-)